MFFQLDGNKDSFPLDRILSVNIGFNGILKEQFIENYPSSLFGEI